MQGGGHSPATHDFGLGADQVLEAQVVLASGELVTASPCENPDLLFAIRGGGPSTYGVVVSTTIKAWPNTRIVAQQLSIAPLTPADIQSFMAALAIIHQAYPDLLDGGFSGYGSWSIATPTPLFANFTAGYTHKVAKFSGDLEAAKSISSALISSLEVYKESLFINKTYYSFPTYQEYYSKLSGVVGPVGTSAALGSRLLDRKALTGNPTKLKATLQTLAGEATEYTSNNVVLVGGGQVFKDAQDPYSGVNPAWRQTYVHSIVARGWAPGSDAATQEAVHHDITFRKMQAMRNLAPDTGSYMNEGDYEDPEYLQDFYGKNLKRLSDIQRRYDPHDVFYCPTCIGSERWIATGNGTLCRH